MEMKHTPTPWVRMSRGKICSEKDDGYVFLADTDVSTCTYQPSPELIKANAEFIVKAANCHDDLLEACKEADGMLSFAGCPNPHDGTEQCQWCAYMSQIKAAIKKATGE